MPAGTDNDRTASARILLKDLFNTSNAATESLLGQLTPEQIHLIEDTINRIKRRKLDKRDDAPATAVALPTPAASPGPSSPSASSSSVSDAESGANATTSTAAPSANTATAIASALASAVACAALAASNKVEQQPSPSAAVPAIAPSSDNHQQQQQQQQQHDPVAEMRDGVEWVSFVYSHNRTLRRYNIRTDLHTVSLDAIDAKFKEENCVYPRANLPREQYQGNRWNYETECNVLGWKLAWLNASEISGKRGLIQRAVDSYRNRYPSMRSRRVARQEKLLNGTLRKRKHRDDTDHPPSPPPPVSAKPSAASPAALSANLAAAIVKPANHPKTLVLDEAGSRIRIKVNVEAVNLDEIPLEFRKINCVFPRAINMYAGARWLEESLCNELGWRLAWLNQRQLAGKKSLLQRALDVFRKRFMPSLQPRKQSARPVSLAINTGAKTMPLTAAALSAQNAWYEQQEQQASTGSATKGSPAPSCASGTTITLDFADCFSLADDDDDVLRAAEGSNACCDKQLCSCGDELSTIMSSSTACTPSPTSNIFGFPPEVDLYDSFTLPPATDMSHFMDIDPKPSPSSSSSSASSPFSAASLAPATTLTTSLKLPDALLASPSLPSSAVQQQDLVAKDDMILLPSDLAMPSDAERFLFDLF